jgi:hypothetical protein
MVRFPPLIEGLIGVVGCPVARSSQLSTSNEAPRSSPIGFPTVLGSKGASLRPSFTPRAISKVQTAESHSEQRYSYNYNSTRQRYNDHTSREGSSGRPGCRCRRPSKPEAGMLQPKLRRNAPQTYSLLPLTHSWPTCRSLHHRSHQRRQLYLPTRQSRQRWDKQPRKLTHTSYQVNWTRPYRWSQRCSQKHLSSSTT